MPPISSNPHADSHHRRFATTQWSIVLAAGDVGRQDARQALSQLCLTYWYPLYAYVRRRGYSAHDAQDLTQAFFERILEKHGLEVADPARGRFRSFLLASMDHFLANEYDRRHAQKRGGGESPLSLDLTTGESRLHLELADNLTPERLFERKWALTLLDEAVRRLEAEYRHTGKGPLFDALRDALTGDRDRLPYAEIGAEVGLTDNACRQAAHRLRSRYRQLLREEVARTVADPAAVDEELADLLRALGN